MKIKKFNSSLIVKIDKDTKRNASNILATKGLSLSDFVRNNIDTLIKKEEKKKNDC